MADFKSVQLTTQTTQEDSSQLCACTLIDMPGSLQIWLETEDGEGAHSFTEAQFNELVRSAKELKGWA